MTTDMKRALNGNIYAICGGFIGGSSSLVNGSVDGFFAGFCGAVCIANIIMLVVFLTFGRERKTNASELQVCKQ